MKSENDNKVSKISPMQCKCFKTLKASRKNASENVVCWSRLLKISILTLQTNLSIYANSVDPEQIAPLGAVWSESTLFVIEAS